MVWDQERSKGECGYDVAANRPLFAGKVLFSMDWHLGILSHKHAKGPPITHRLVPEIGLRQSRETGG